MNKRLFIILFILLVFLTSCSRFSKSDEIDTSIEDNQQLYKEYEENPGNIRELYVTVLKPSKRDEDYNYTLAQLNETILEPSKDYDPEVKVIFQEGVNGKIDKGNYGYGMSDFNATMELRGQSARIADLKSYKINLNKRAPWDNFVTVNLNKHPFDNLRVRNKLAFELIKDIPNITSARTQFVNLFIKDYSEGNFDGDFVDYGLFTQIENIDQLYLKNHNLDDNGYLYKVENFEFQRYEDTLLNVDDRDYDKSDFEDILEIKGRNDHTKLIQMLSDVNNEFIHINKIIDYHFDRDNLLTWLALNILTDNVDTQSRNYFLYSPQSSPTWYFLPWDFDKGLGGYTDERPIWQTGISNHWGNSLIRRFVQNDQNRADLTKKIEDLAAIMNEEKIDYYISYFKPLSLYFLSKNPDNENGKVNFEEVNEDFNNLHYSIEKNKNAYYESLERPMPVFLGTPYVSSNFIQFNWTPSYDFQKDEIFYSIEVSDSPYFDEIIYKKDGLTSNEYITKKLPPGHYFYRVYSFDVNKNKSDAFDIYIDEENLVYIYGVKEFFIN